MGDSARRARIAVINDDTDFLNLMRVLLEEEEDFEVLICKEWDHAYQFVKDEQPALVIQDIADSALHFSPVPSTTNPLGAKGVGEGGTVASTPTVMNAILDALAPLGVTDVPMPATPERIWRAMREQGG